MEILAAARLLGAGGTSPVRALPVPVVPSRLIGHRQLPICRANMSRAACATAWATVNLDRKETVW